MEGCGREVFATATEVRLGRIVFRRRLAGRLFFETFAARGVLDPDLSFVRFAVFLRAAAAFLAAFLFVRNADFKAFRLLRARSAEALACWRLFFRARLAIFRVFFALFNVALSALACLVAASAPASSARILAGEGFKAFLDLVLDFMM